jgi:hypothetical protein
MNYSNIEKIIDYGSTYRKQELADYLEGFSAWELADDLCAIMLTIKATMPEQVYKQMVENLLRFQSDVQFQLMVEEDEDNSGNS